MPFVFVHIHIHRHLLVVVLLLMLILGLISSIGSYSASVCISIFGERLDEEYPLSIVFVESLSAHSFAVFVAEIDDDVEAVCGHRPDAVIAVLGQLLNDGNAPRLSAETLSRFA